MNWILERMKAWAALAIPAIVLALLSTFEQAVGFPVPAEIKTLIVSGVTSLVVYMVPNKPAAAA